MATKYKGDMFVSILMSLEDGKLIPEILKEMKVEFEGRMKADKSMRDKYPLSMKFYEKVKG